MADSTDPRFGVTQWADENSAWPGVIGWDAELAKLTGQAARGMSGLSNQRPSPAVSNTLFWATDQNRMYWSDGSVWTEISPVRDGSVSPDPTQFTQAGVAPGSGDSRVAAAVNHIHRQPPWPTQKWGVNRGPGVAAPFGPGGFIGITPTLYFNGPPGNWMFGLNTSMRTQSAAAGSAVTTHLRVTLSHPSFQGGNINLSADQPVDLGPSWQPIGLTWTETITDSGVRAMALGFSADASNGAAVVQAGRATGVWAQYMGPGQ